ncbi:hypothetical protein [Paenibacillus herberti]|uniref:Aminodeoxychorismate lyase n=1 Tax=Paenibacillus herberti TaxID=1619309 RepID=A0A229P1A0_9BACL|nr:hypothetical protein [Paenibacillus herberti]OXM16013.1 hypothetical protein CGZ75_04725 [Paenibacillus herberti]
MKRLSRSFWTGLGLGIMIGALLLQLLLIGQTAPELDKPAGSSDEQPVYTVEEAEALAQTAVARALADWDKTAGGKKDGTEQTPAPGSGSGEGSKPSPTPTSAAGKGVKDAGTPSTKPNTATKSQPVASSKSDSKGQTSPKPETELVIRIMPGSNLTDTAALLKKHGLVDSEQSFIRYMEGQKTASDIRAGYFKFVGNPDLAAIKATITGQPMDPKAGKAWLAAHSD